MPAERITKTDTKHRTNYVVLSIGLSEIVVPVSEVFPFYLGVRNIHKVAYATIDEFAADNASCIWILCTNHQT